MREAMPDVGVLLPGILGSVLRKDGRDVWAASGGAVLAGILSGGGSIRELALREDDLADDLGDGVTADRLIPDVHLLPGLWKIDGYSKIKQTIFTVFDVREDENYFEFPYDSLLFGNSGGDLNVGSRRSGCAPVAWCGSGPPLPEPALRQMSGQRRFWP